MLFDPPGASEVRLSARNVAVMALPSATISLSNVVYAQPLAPYLARPGNRHRDIDVRRVRPQGMKNLILAWKARIRLIFREVATEFAL